MANEVVSRVWSAYGHKFHATGDGYQKDDGRDVEYNSCMTCGAEYELVPGYVGSTMGSYQARNGDEPKECTDNTQLHHGYEAVCTADNGRSCEEYRTNWSAEGCQHLAVIHGCNCIQCTG